MAGGIWQEGAQGRKKGRKKELPQLSSIAKNSAASGFSAVPLKHTLGQIKTEKVKRTV